MNKIKIGYFADGPWSHLAFEKIILDNSIEVLFIVPRNDTKDETLKKYAKEYNIPYITNVKVNAPEFIKIVINYRPDLLVSMSFNQIFKKEIINLTPQKIINCHAGKLPFYRGRNILNWVLINDEKEFGITAHFIDEGIDTGDIILQRTYPINDHDDYNSLLNKAYTECAVVIYDAIKIIQKGNVKVIFQQDIHPVGMYCGQRSIGDENLNWNMTSREIFNFVRAICSPGPMAQCKVKGSNTILKINKINLIKDAPNYRGIPGQIIGKMGDNFVVKTKDSFVEITDFTLNNEKLKIGTRLV